MTGKQGGRNDCRVGARDEDRGISRGSVGEGQFGGYQAHAIMDELQIKSGFDTFDDFTPPTAPFTY